MVSRCSSAARVIVTDFNAKFKVVKHVACVIVGSAILAKQTHYVSVFCIIYILNVYPS